MRSHLHHEEAGGASAQKTRGFVWNWAWHYDLLMGLVTLGREQAFRQRIADLARLQPGEGVLDVGCGTRTLALVARQRVGETGRMSGIDPSPQMIARARHKAARRSLSLDFQVGVIEQLAFPDQSFDVVLSTFMMHHLPDDLKRRGLREIADQPALMKEAGFSQVETGETRFSRFPGLGFALGRINRAGEGKTDLY